MELVIDTASGALSVALIDGPTVVSDYHAVIGRGHAETIVGIDADLVGDRGGTVRGIVVDIGPGSFTGVRIGIAAARALGLAWGVSVAGVGALALIAAAAFAADPTDVVVATTDAGRGEIYWQVFARAGLTALTAPVAGSVVMVIVPEGAGIAGTGAAAISGRHIAVAEPRARDARLLPMSARGDPDPLYLRSATA